MLASKSEIFLGTSKATSSRTEGSRVKIKERLEFTTKPPVATLRGEEKVTAAIESMAQRNIGSVVIVDDDMKVQGIVTERDLVRRLLKEKLDPDTTPLSNIMTTEPRTANEDDDVVECLRLMSNERFRHLPIVDESGRLISILSQGDFVAYTWPELLVLVRKKAKETLRPNTYTLVAILFYTLIVIAMSNIWQDFTFR
jgi:CBS domain-containing protein